MSIIDTRILSLELDEDVTKIRALQKKRDACLERKKKHQSVMEMSRCAPAVSLKHVVILSSNAICADCASFTDRVNVYFRLGSDGIVLKFV